MCGFDWIQRSNYFGGEPVARPEVEVSVGKLKNGKAAGNDELTGEMMKGRSDRMVDWNWRLCNMAFENGVVYGDWKSAVIAAMCKGKGEKMECRNNRGVSSLSMTGKIHAGILADRIRRVTGGLTDDE